MAKKKNSIKKEKIIEVLQQIPEKDLRSFLEKIICGPVVKARFLKEFDAYFINEKSADVYIEQIIGVFYDLRLQRRIWMHFFQQTVRIVRQNV